MGKYNETDNDAYLLQTNLLGIHSIKELEEAAERLAYFKSELNMLHPLRERNDRATRIFIYAYALSKGIVWAYETIRFQLNSFKPVVYRNHTI